MMWQTHALGGIAALWPLALLPSTLLAYDYGTLAACAACGALLPDMDAAESKIKHVRIGQVKPFALAATLLHRKFGHRGLLHSKAGLLLLAALGLPLMFIVGWAPVAALIIGYASHLAADACTKTGIPWCYPQKTRHHLLPPSLRIVTGSPEEGIAFALAAAGAITLLLSHLSAR